MSTEEWRRIPGYAGYEVSDQGRMVSHHRGASREIKPYVDADGYAAVHLRADDGRSPVVRVHVLVLLAFVGARPDGRIIRHLDGDPTNNGLVNLCYGTASENSLDQVRHGTHPFARRTHCKHGHEYSPENTATWTSSKGRPFRMCRTCHNAKRARQRASKSAA